LLTLRNLWLPLKLSAGKMSKLIYLFIIPDILAYIYLLGTWGVELVGSSSPGYISLLAAESMGYSVILASIAFLVWAFPKAKRVVILALSAGLVVGAVVALNLIPGLGIAIGVMFPYAFGILGVTDWMPPIIFALALASGITAVWLSRRERGMTITFLALAAAALIFDSVNITTYLIAPLVAICVGLLLDGRIRKLNLPDSN